MAPSNHRHISIRVTTDRPSAVHPRTPYPRPMAEEQSAKRVHFEFYDPADILCILESRYVDRRLKYLIHIKDGVPEGVWVPYWDLCERVDLLAIFYVCKDLAVGRTWAEERIKTAYTLAKSQNH